MGVTLGRLVRDLGIAGAALGLVVALATSAGAADVLTGSYAGKLTCKGLVAGAPAKTKQDITIAVSDSKIALAMEIRSGATQIGDALRGFVMDDSGKPDRAKLFAVDCDMNLVSLSNLTLIADAVAKEGSDKATLKGALTDTTGKTQILDCTFSVKRTSTAPPKFEGCILE
jgi:hypothetical protein